MGRKKPKVFVSAGDVDAELGVDTEELKNSKEERTERTSSKARRSKKNEENKEDSLVDSLEPEPKEEANLVNDAAKENEVKTGDSLGITKDENENFGEKSETADDDFGDDGDKSDDLNEADDSNESEISDDEDEVFKEDKDEFADEEDVDENENFGKELEAEDDDFGDDGDESDDFDEVDDSDESEISDDDDGDLDEDNDEFADDEDVDENENFGEESETEDDDFDDDGDKSDDLDESDDSNESEISDDDDGDLDEDNDEFADDEDVDENENFGEESETEDDDFGDDGDKSDDLDEADDSNESEISDDDDGDLDEVETGDVELGKHEGNMEASQGRGEASAKNEDSGLDGGKVHGEVADAIEEEESFHEENEIAVNRVPTEQKLAEPVLKETKQSFHKIALKSGDLNVTLTFETGRQKMTLGELETIRNGYTFVCENPIEGPVEIRANGTLIGYGQLVDVEGKFGVQITEFTKNVSGL